MLEKSQLDKLYPRQTFPLVILGKQNQLGSKQVAWPSKTATEEQNDLRMCMAKLYAACR